MYQKMLMAAFVNTSRITNVRLDKVGMKVSLSSGLLSFPSSATIWVLLLFYMDSSSKPLLNSESVWEILCVISSREWDIVSGRMHTQQGQALGSDLSM